MLTVGMTLTAITLPGEPKSFAPPNPCPPEYLDNCRLSERLECIVQATGDVIWDRDLETGEFWWNDSAEKVFRLTLTEAVQNPDWCIDQVHPDDREGYVKGIRAFLDGATSS